MNITGLGSGTNYYFWVSSVKDGQESAKSPVVSILTAAAVPVNPSPNVSNNMVRIQGGTFTMGSPASEVDRQINGQDETQHRVTVSSFSIGKYEVTQREYVSLMGTNPSKFKGDNRPVEMVTWYDAVNYCNALSRKEGLTPAYTVSGTNVTWNRSANGYRLPTEAEWEYACRAGTTTPYSSESSIDDIGWYKNNSGSTTHPVGTKQANAWGLYDMHGNVWEWCWDLFRGDLRRSRSGSWYNYADRLRSASRGGASPSIQTDYTGFRIVRSSL
jgi:formylglycine-generating enzyme required for sulfatase activity